MKSLAVFSVSICILAGSSSQAAEPLNIGAPMVLSERSAFIIEPPSLPIASCVWTGHDFAVFWVAADKNPSGRVELVASRVSLTGVVTQPKTVLSLTDYPSDFGVAWTGDRFVLLVVRYPGTLIRHILRPDFSVTDRESVIAQRAHNISSIVPFGDSVVFAWSEAPLGGNDDAYIAQFWPRARYQRRFPLEVSEYQIWNRIALASDGRQVVAVWGAVPPCHGSFPCPISAAERRTIAFSGPELTERWRLFEQWTLRPLVAAGDGNFLFVEATYGIGTQPLSAAGVYGNFNRAQFNTLLDSASLVHTSDGFLMAVGLWGVQVTLFRYDNQGLAIDGSQGIVVDEATGSNAWHAHVAVATSPNGVVLVVYRNATDKLLRARFVTQSATALESKEVRKQTEAVADRTP